MSYEKNSVWVEQAAALSRLVGARLTSVQFVLDHLILGFDEKGALTSLVWPIVSCGNKATAVGANGYRDDLCSLIGKHTTSANITPGETIEINFEGGLAMQIPLGAYQGYGERAILTGPEHYLFVF